MVKNKICKQMWKRGELVILNLNVLLLVQQLVVDSRSLIALCPQGRFGLDCVGVCQCLEGPFVCHSKDGRCTSGPCRPGWRKPPFCQTECPDYTFGFNCSYRCHCPVHDVCNKVNGLCPSGRCARGWTGPSCQTILPTMPDPPGVTWRTATSVVVSWPSWYVTSAAAADARISRVVVESYVIEMKTNFSSTASVVTQNWIEIGRVAADKSNLSAGVRYSYIAEDLRSDTSYQFRLVLTWLNSNKPHTSLPGPATEWITYPCDFLEAPSNVSARSESGSVQVRWTIPVSPVNCSGPCCVSQYQVLVNCPFIECSSVKWIVPHPINHAVIPVSQFSVVGVRMAVRAISRSGLVGKKSAELRLSFSSSEDQQIGEDNSLRSGSAIEFTDADQRTTNTTVFDLLFRLAARSVDHLLFTPTARLSIEATRVDDVMNTGSISGNWLQPHNPRAVITDDGRLIVSNLTAANEYVIRLSIVDVLTSKVLTTFTRRFWTLLPPGRNPAPVPLRVTKIMQTMIELSAAFYQQKRSVVGDNGDGDSLARDDRIIQSYYIVVDKLTQQDDAMTSKFGAAVASGSANIHDHRITPAADSVLILRNYSDESDAAGSHHVAGVFYSWPPSEKFTVGSGDLFYVNSSNGASYYNGPLHQGQRYMLWFGNGMSLDGAEQLSWIQLAEPVQTVASAGMDVGAIVGIFLGCVAIVLFTTAILCLLLVRQKLRRQQPTQAQQQKQPPPPAAAAAQQKNNSQSSELPDHGGQSNGDVINASSEHARFLSTTTSDKLDVSLNRSLYVQHYKSWSPIRVADLWQDFGNRLQPNRYYSLRVEFQRIPKGQTDACSWASAPQLVAFNVSPDALPYDKNCIRVAQKRGPASYINASRIRTAETSSSSIIVSQRTCRKTVDRFWQTVWDEQVKTIVMLYAHDNVPEEGGSRRPYFQYWPPTARSKVYGSVEVELVLEETRSHYCMRILEIRGWMNNEFVSRTVVHWQFVRWRLCGRLPVHPIQFCDFVTQVQSRRDQSSAMLIHCETGSGPSGVFLAVDLLATEGRKTGRVDVEECVTLLCMERMNLVETFQQYRFIYWSLLELFNVHHETNIPVYYFSFVYSGLKRRNIHTGWTPIDREYVALFQPCYGFCIRKLLSASFDHASADTDGPNVCNSTESFNDVRIDGFRSQDQFVIPSLETSSDPVEFWEQVYCLRAQSVVAMCPLRTDASWLPEPGKSVLIGRLTLTCGSLQANQSKTFYVHNLTVRPVDSCKDIGRQKHNVRFYECTGWPDDIDLPSVSLVLEMVLSLTSTSRQRRPVVFYGTTAVSTSRAAMVSVVYNVLNRMLVENVVNVFTASRYVWTRVPNAFTSKDHYVFIYEVLNEHITRIQSQNRPVNHSNVPSWARPVESFSTTVQPGGDELNRELTELGSAVCPNEPPCRDTGPCTETQRQPTTRLPQIVSRQHGLNSGSSVTEDKVIQNGQPKKLRKKRRQQSTGYDQQLDGLLSTPPTRDGITGVRIPTEEEILRCSSPCFTIPRQCQKFKSNTKSKSDAAAVDTSRGRHEVVWIKDSEVLSDTSRGQSDDAVKSDENCEPTPTTCEAGECNRHQNTVWLSSDPLKDEDVLEERSKVTETLWFNGDDDVDKSSVCRRTSKHHQRLPSTTCRHINEHSDKRRSSSLSEGCVKPAAVTRQVSTRHSDKMRKQKPEGHSNTSERVGCDFLHEEAPMNEHNDSSAGCSHYTPPPTSNELCHNQTSADGLITSAPASTPTVHDENKCEGKAPQKVHWKKLCVEDVDHANESTLTSAEKGCSGSKLQERPSALKLKDRVNVSSWDPCTPCESDYKRNVTEPVVNEQNGRKSDKSVQRKKQETQDKTEMDTSSNLASASTVNDVIDDEHMPPNTKRPSRKKEVTKSLEQPQQSASPHDSLSDCVDKNLLPEGNRSTPSVLIETTSSVQGQVAPGGSDSNVKQSSATAPHEGLFNTLDHDAEVDRNESKLVEDRKKCESVSLETEIKSKSEVSMPESADLKTNNRKRTLSKKIKKLTWINAKLRKKSKSGSKSPGDVADESSFTVAPKNNWKQPTAEKLEAETDKISDVTTETGVTGKDEHVNPSACEESIFGESVSRGEKMVADASTNPNAMKLLEKGKQTETPENAALQSSSTIVKSEQFSSASYASSAGDRKIDMWSLGKIDDSDSIDDQTLQKGIMLKPKAVRRVSYDMMTTASRTSYPDEFDDDNRKPISLTTSDNQAEATSKSQTGDFAVCCENNDTIKDFKKPSSASKSLCEKPSETTTIADAITDSGHSRELPVSGNLPVFSLVSECSSNRCNGKMTVNSEDSLNKNVVVDKTDFNCRREVNNEINDVTSGSRNESSPTLIEDGLNACDKCHEPHAAVDRQEEPTAGQQDCVSLTSSGKSSNGSGTRISTSQSSDNEGKVKASITKRQRESEASSISNRRLQCRMLREAATSRDLLNTPSTTSYVSDFDDTPLYKLDRNRCTASEEERLSIEGDCYDSTTRFPPPLRTASLADDGSKRRQQKPEVKESRDQSHKIETTRRLTTDYSDSCSAMTFVPQSLSLCQMLPSTKDATETSKTVETICNDRLSATPSHSCDDLHVNAKLACSSEGGATTPDQLQSITDQSSMKEKSKRLRDSISIYHSRRQRLTTTTSAADQAQLRPTITTRRSLDDVKVKESKSSSKRSSSRDRSQHSQSAASVSEASTLMSEVRSRDSMMSNRARLTLTKHTDSVVDVVNKTSTTDCEPTFSEVINSRCKNRLRENETPIGNIKRKSPAAQRDKSKLSVKLSDKQVDHKHDTRSPSTERQSTLIAAVADSDNTARPKSGTLTDSKVTANKRPCVESTCSKQVTMAISDTVNTFTINDASISDESAPTKGNSATALQATCIKSADNSPAVADTDDETEKPVDDDRRMIETNSCSDVSVSSATRRPRKIRHEEQVDRETHHESTRRLNTGPSSSALSVNDTALLPSTTPSLTNCRLLELEKGNDIQNKLSSEQPTKVSAVSNNPAESSDSCKTLSSTHSFIAKEKGPRIADTAHVESSTVVSNKTNAAAAAAAAEQASTSTPYENNYESDWDAESDENDEPDQAVSLVLPEKAHQKLLDKPEPELVSSKNSSFENLIAHILD